MKYKLIASDFDNTIAARDCVISDYTKKTVAEYIARGGKFVICTGRMFAASKKFAVELGLKGELIAYQGAAVFDIESEKVLFSDAIENEVAVEILKYFENFNYIITHAYSPMRYNARFDNPVTRKYDDFCKIKGNILNEKLSEYYKRTKEELLKIVAFVPSAEIDDFIKEINKKYGKYVFAMKSQATFLEVTNVAASKGTAVKHIAERYGIKREEVMCFGDATNDISMIEYAGMGVAVGNSMQELKDVADYVCEPVTENGMAKTIERLCLNE